MKKKEKLEKIETIHGKDFTQCTHGITSNDWK